MTRLVDETTTHGQVVYAVPGSPLVLEDTVRRLRTDNRVRVTLLPAMSFLDLVWNALEIDPIENSVRLIDGHRFAATAAGDTGPLLIAHCHANWVLSDIKLSIENPHADTEVVILQALGTNNQKIVRTTWSELDRTIEPDHLTSVYVPHLAVPVARELQAVHELAVRLRKDCPWDREQTHDTLVRYLIEEAYEVVEALANVSRGKQGADEELIEELGDLLYQIEFHCAIAEEQGRFNIADVASTLHAKMVRRHPHVFGPQDNLQRSADDVVDLWQQVKQQEREKSGKVHDIGDIFSGVNRHLPALSYAEELQRKVAKVGFDWPDSSGALEKVAEEANEVALADPSTLAIEFGDLLFSLVNLARHLSVDPEAALRSATAKFQTRVNKMQALALSRDAKFSSLNLAELDLLWEEAKRSN